jgi:hypothetical protein
MRSFSLVTIAALICAAGAVLHQNQGAKYTTAAYAAASATPAASVRQVYFSPGSNLEQVDDGLIHQARSSITVAMYTFTDRNLALCARRSSETRHSDPHLSRPRPVLSRTAARFRGVADSSKPTQDSAPCENQPRVDARESCPDR